MNEQDATLAGVRVALAESRELDLFADMLISRGAQTLRCPLVTICDTPDRDAVEAWLRRFVERRPDWLILLTGEGLRRLNGFAERAGLQKAFHDALAKTPTLCRGPKPGRALRPLGLKPHRLAESPTSAGVIRSLQQLPLDGARVAVQLYGQEPNPALMQALVDAGAEADPVAPYVYRDDLDDPAVLALLDRLRDGEVDCMAFTSKSQVTRLFAVAGHAGRTTELRQAFSRLLLASIGPVVTDALAHHGVTADLQPGQSYFMKPLVRELVAARRAGRMAPAAAD